MEASHFGPEQESRGSRALGALRSGPHKGEPSKAPKHFPPTPSTPTHRVHRADLHVHRCLLSEDHSSHPIDVHGNEK